MEETEAKREKTQRALDCTRTVLHKTEGERAEQVRLRAERVRPEGSSGASEARRVEGAGIFIFCA